MALDTPESGGSSSGRINRYRRLRTALDQERSSFLSLWRDLADFLVPSRMRINPSDRNRGDRRNTNIIDCTATFAARTLESGLHAGLTSPARPWFKLSTHDQKLGEQQPVKEWLHVVTTRMLQMFLQTNIYNTLPTVYGDMGVFGTAAMAVLPDERDLFRCYAYPLGSYWFGLDKRGIVSTFMREYQLTVRQVIEEFALKEDGSIDRSVVSKTVLDQWDRGDAENQVPVTWIVSPNDQRDDSRLAAKFLPFASCYFETNDSKGDRFLRETGFKTFPIMGPRWDVTGEDVYGTDCPGIIALGDVRGLQTEQRRKAQGIWKMVDPPLQAPPQLRTQKTSLLPGDITYAEMGPTGRPVITPLHEVTLNLEHLSRDIYDVQNRIDKAFYVDLFLMLAQSDRMRGSQPVTAREVDERHEEKLIALGPVLERTNDELLGPAIDRVFGMMVDAGMFPPPPPQLEGVNLKVEYTSILAQAQKLIGVVGHDRFFMSTGQMIGIYPEIRHKVNIFQAVDDYADQLGVDPRIIRPTDEAQELLDAEHQAAAQAAEAEQMKATAGAMKDASQADLTSDNALTRLASAAGGPRI